MRRLLIQKKTNERGERREMQGSFVFAGIERMGWIVCIIRKRNGTTG